MNMRFWLEQAEVEHHQPERCYRGQAGDQGERAPYRPRRERPHRQVDARRVARRPVPAREGGDQREGQCNAAARAGQVEPERQRQAVALGQAVIVGDAVSDKLLRAIATPGPYPHGIAVYAGIDRMLVTSTVRASDLKDPGEAMASSSSAQAR